MTRLESLLRIKIFGSNIKPPPVIYYIVTLYFQGYLLNWDVQKNVWDYMFSKDCCNVNFSETPLIITEPFFNFPSLQEAMIEIFFEEYDCQSILRIPGKMSFYLNY